MEQQCKHVLFDFDGVIADTFAAASALALRQCKHETVDAYRSAFEGNIYDTFDKDAPGGGRPIDHGPECEHDLDWWAEYQKLLVDARAFEGIQEVIMGLAAQYQLAIISSATKAIIEPILERFEVRDLFSDILDADVHTKKTKKIEMLFEKYGVGARECVFVTDTLGDIREAAHHSVGAIACTWGFHPRETLEKGMPFRIVETPREIPDAVAEYFAV